MFKEFWSELRGFSSGINQRSANNHQLQPKTCHKEKKNGSI